MNSSPHPLKGGKCSPLYARILIVCCGIMMLSSCRMSKELHKKAVTETEKTTTSIDAVDTSTTTTVTEGTVTTKMGDTLSGSLQFDESDYLVSTPANDYFTDSLESNGVKVSVSLVKTKTGIKAKVKAIAKPAAIINHFKETKTEVKGVAVKAVVSDEKKSTSVTKDLETTSFPIGIVILLIIVAIAAWFINKYKNFI